MDIIEKLGDTISAKGKEVADKAKELAEIANLKSRISTYEDIVKKNYAEIGRIYYEQYGNMPEEPFDKACRSIRIAKGEIEDLQEQIREIKGM